MFCRYALAAIRQGDEMLVAFLRLRLTGRPDHVAHRKSTVENVIASERRRHGVGHSDITPQILARLLDVMIKVCLSHNDRQGLATCLVAHRIAQGGILQPSDLAVEGPVAEVDHIPAQELALIFP